MGYIEETGAALHWRDSRILTIFEGTTGIQANDLVGRKIMRDGGAAIVWRAGTTFIRARSAYGGVGGFVRLHENNPSIAIDHRSGAMDTSTLIQGCAIHQSTAKSRGSRRQVSQEEDCAQLHVERSADHQ